MDSIVTQSRPVGRFLDSLNPTMFELGPYERMEISKQIGTVALMECSASRVMLRVGSTRYPIDHGSCVPVNGHQVFVENPFGVAIRGQLIFDLPVQLSTTSGPSSARYAESTTWYLTTTLEKDAALKAGYAFMPKRGVHRVMVYGSTNMSVFVLRNARADFVEQMPAGMMEEVGSPLYSDGSPANNIVARLGHYSDADVASWIAATGWGDVPQLIATGDASVTVRCDEKTGIFVSYDPNVACRFAVLSYDVGEAF